MPQIPAHLDALKGYMERVLSFEPVLASSDYSAETVLWGWGNARA